MMGGLLFLITVVLVPVICARLVAGKLYAFYLSGLICFAGTAFLLMLLLLNDEFPFTGGGDDLGYFDASHQSFTSLSDWFDTSRYESSHEQAGYPLLLSWVQQFSGPSLFLLKAFNVFLMLQIAVVWFGIGDLVGGKRLAFIYASGMLAATPLWFYWLFLAKDLTITLLQSIFVLGLIMFVSGEHRFRGCAMIALSTLAVIPFRSMLAVLNVALLVACTFLREWSGSSGVSFRTRLVLVASLVLGLWLFSTQPGMMEALGVKGEHRSLTAEGVLLQLERTESERHSSNFFLFTVLYLVGETNALNPENWGRFDLENLRPLSMVPWIFFGLPFFLAGVTMMLGRTRLWRVFASCLGHNNPRRIGKDLTQCQITCLQALLGFTAAYAAIGWLTGTTVRWTLPAFPAMVGIAAFAWANMDGQARIRLLTSFDFSFATLLLCYYLVLN